MPLPGLKPYQIELSAGVLYKIWAQPSLSRTVKDGSAAQLAPSIEVLGDTADVYGSQVQPDTAPTNMGLLFDELTGVRAFTVIPNFIYVDGSPSSIVVSGVGVEAVEQLESQTQIEVFTSADLAIV